MKRVLVNVKWRDKVVDLEIPCDLAISTFVEIVEGTFDMKSSRIERIHVVDNQTILGREQSFADTCLRDGNRIELI